VADPIIESDMAFISDGAYPIEKSQAYTSVGESIRTVEFIRRKDTELLFVEAKTTFPNPDSHERPWRFDEEISIICEKFIHSLNLFSAVSVGVVEDVSLDALGFSGKISLVFVLVVRDHKIEWCRIIKSKLIQELPAYLKKIWKPTVKVCNLDIAKELNLVS
jgi:hypothetical protein